MKKLLYLSLVGALMVSQLMVSVAYGAPPASRQSTDGAMVDDPAISPQETRRLDEECTKKEAQFGIVKNAKPMCACGAKGAVAAACLTASRTYGYRVKSTPCFAQVTSYYCGPASAQQSLYWHKSNSGSSAALPSQYTLASYIGTETYKASSTTGIASALNRYNGTFGTFYYTTGDISNTVDPLGSFYNRIGGMLASNYGGTVPIILVQTSYIPRYSGRVSRHYITVSGINDTVVPVKMLDVDPNWTSAYRGTFWDPVGCTAVNGLMRACYQADLGGSNRAMAW